MKVLGLRFQLDNTVNEDVMYFGCVNQDGRIYIFNQYGEKQVVTLYYVSVVPHQKYVYNSDELIVLDDNKANKD